MCFNSRSRVGSDPAALLLVRNICSFNSRSRVGSDSAASCRSGRGGVSIRAPAWGATAVNLVMQTMRLVSIRAPAWGATYSKQAH